MIKGTKRSKLGALLRAKEYDKYAVIPSVSLYDGLSSCELTQCVLF